MKNELYSEIVRVLTEYENPQDAQLTECEAALQVYDTLVKVQNAIDNGELSFTEE